MERILALVGCEETEEAGLELPPKSEARRAQLYGKKSVCQFASASWFLRSNLGNEHGGL